MQPISFPLNPLAACIRLAIASGLFFNAISPAQAELPIPAHSFVETGAASTQTKGDTLTIHQTTDKATLNWDKFNVGKENHVDFQQPSSSSIALNRINDKTSDEPSKILGEVSANGQVYLYNNNGFVFGKDSTVNANSAVVSTLEITDEAMKGGITQQAGVDSDKPSLGSDKVANSKAEINVEKGARLHVGKDGLMVLAAPTVNNKGSLSADNYGQVVLVASKDKVYLQATDKNSPFHGMLVEVDTGGKVTNAGEVLAKQGNVTMEGFAVSQAGRVTATTSVNENGSIRLLAQEQHSIQSGKIIATKNRARH
jgi:filamentous hemagglutinin family protein